MENLLADRAQVALPLGFHIGLATLWIMWCALHSILIAQSVTEYLQAHLKTHYRYYRLFYTLFSLVTIIPLVLYTHGLREEESIFQWEGWPNLVRYLLVGFAVLFFVLGAKGYDLFQFLGLRQIRQGQMGTGIAAEGKVSTTGILAVVRHPWYTGALLLLWSRHLTLVDFMVNIILTGSLLSRYKSNKVNWLQRCSDAFWRWIFVSNCKISTFSKRQMVKICRISVRPRSMFSCFLTMATST